MALTGSLQLSLSLGFCRNHERSNKFKYVTGRETRQSIGNKLSSCASRQDSWSGRLSSSTNRTLYTLPYKCSPLRCHSFLVFGQNISVPTMKSATVALTRSCNSIQANPLVTKFVPAAAIIVFTLWGLQPLMQFSRRIFLRKSDSSWKKSTENYVMSSYLQPILLWTAAILICRNLEPIAMPTEASEVVKQRLLNFVKSLSTVLAFAYCLSSVIQQAQKYFLETSDPSETRNMSFQFAGKAVYTAVWVAAVSLFMELLGFSTQKWLTAGGLGTVLLTLAGREIFTNFLSSAMIHATRPFVANEWIQTKIEGYEVSGTVEHVGWWSPTVIRGEDREAVHIPNHKFTVNVVRNLSQKTHWRIKTHLAISHLDASKINSIVADMRKVLAKNPQVEQQKLHRRVFLENVNPENQAMMILISCFVKTSHHEEYLCVKEAILLDLLRVIKHHRARLATPIRTIQKYYNEPDLDSMSFSDSIFTRAGPMSKRPVLLIEPPYKINGEDKSKSQARAARTSEIQDINGSEQSTVELNVDAKVKGLSTPELNAKEMPKSGNKTDGVAPDSSNVDPSVEGKASVASKAEPKSDSKASVASKAEPKADGKASAVSKGSSNPELKNKDMPQPGNKADGKEAGSSNVGPNIENRASVTSKSDPKSDAKATVKTTPRPKSGSVKSSAPNGNALKNIENGQPKGNTETQGNDDKTSNPTLSTQAKHGDKSTASEPSKSTAPALEENIVLEVALEGSKRTLPIEEDDTSKTSAEVKELATRSNETGTPSGNKDEKNT